MVLVIVPFWTSFLIRIYAWINILQHDGLLNQILLALHLVSQPVVWLSTDSAMYIGIVYSYLPFMILPLYATLAKMEPVLEEAASDLGAPRWQVFWLVTFPLSLPGVGAGVLLCFIPIVGEFVIPDLLAGSNSLMIGQTLWLEFFTNKDWPVASAAAIVLLVVLLVAAAALRPAAAAAAGGAAEAREVSRLSRFNIASLALGLAFLYLPILILVIYSFNASRLVTVWGGWSLRWYHEFFNDRAMIEAAWMSLRVAVSSATIATLLGTLAAVALSRGERFRGRTLFSGMLYAPLVMPEVITGLSLLLLFVALNAERGFWTVTIAHTTLTMCFVAVVVQSRLGSLDRSLEEAAMDLGCAPVRAFLSRDAAADRARDRRRLDARLHAVAGRSRDRELHHRPRLGDAADPDLFGGAARREARDQRDLHAGDRPDRGRHRRRVARLETVERAGRERRASVAVVIPGDAMPHLGTRHFLGSVRSLRSPRKRAADFRTSPRPPSARPPCSGGRRNRPRPAAARR